MRNRCWPWSHVWTKWKTIETGRYVFAFSYRDGDGDIYETQRRVCENCGKSQHREVTS